VHISKTAIARHHNVAQHVSSKKQFSTKTADRHAHARGYHHARKQWRFQPKYLAGTKNLWGAKCLILGE